MYFHFYKKLSTYFTDNTLPTLDGIISLTISSSFRQLLLAAIHNFGRESPSIQNLALIGVEILFILFTLIFSSFRLKFK